VIVFISAEVISTMRSLATAFDHDQIAAVKKHHTIPFVIERFNVPSITLKTLLSNHNITRLDMLILDTEGYDFEGPKMIDFSELGPAIIQI
jgi:hypothetical protein